MIRGPYATEDERSKAAKSPQTSGDADDICFELNVDTEGRPTISPYPKGFYEGTEA